MVRVLKRDRADGLGFVDEAGVTFRQFYWDVEIADQRSVPRTVVTVLLGSW